MAVFSSSISPPRSLFWGSSVGYTTEAFGLTGFDRTNSKHAIVFDLHLLKDFWGMEHVPWCSQHSCLVTDETACLPRRRSLPLDSRCAGDVQESCAPGTREGSGYARWACRSRGLPLLLYMAPCLGGLENQKMMLPMTSNCGAAPAMYVASPSCTPTQLTLSNPVLWRTSMAISAGAKRAE